jgi:hypothetical protein
MKHQYYNLTPEQQQRMARVMRDGSSTPTFWERALIPSLFYLAGVWSVVLYIILFK